MTSALPPPHIVETPTCTGEVHDQGAQVTRWAPVAAGPVLYVSTAVRYAVGSSIRAGIPVCWPWFGPGRGGAMEPQHGFVRAAPWRLVDRIDGEDGEDDVTFVHRITSDTATSPLWPHAYALQLRSRFGRTLQLSLTTTNTGVEPFEVEEALHAYLVVGDVRKARIEGLGGKSFLDKVTQTERVQSGDLKFTGETDGVYRTSEPVTLHDPVLGRRLVVTTEGAGNVVVWNPWADKAKEVPDIGDDDWTGFVCIEGANAFEHAVTVAPGETHTLSYELEVVEQ